MRRLVSWLLVGACGALAWACGQTPANPSGSGSAGASGSGGSAGAAVAGSGSSGAGASAGGTSAGSGGSTAGSGGSSAGSGGAGGSAGSAGSGGSAGAATIDHNAPGVIVVIGSSTAAGTGPTKPENAWVERYRAYLKTEFVNFELINLAVGGYTTYHVQADDFVQPQGRPAPDKAHNITMGLSKKPGAILINLPTNDIVGNFTQKETMDNFARVTDLAGQAGVLVWVSTTQPRNFADQAQRDLLMSTRDAIKAKYGDHTLDFWTQFAEADGKIKPMWDSGDGTHMNDEAHALLVQEVIKAKVPEAILSKP